MATGNQSFQSFLMARLCSQERRCHLCTWTWQGSRENKCHSLPLCREMTHRCMDPWKIFLKASIVSGHLHLQGDIIRGRGKSLQPVTCIKHKMVKLSKREQASKLSLNCLSLVKLNHGTLFALIQHTHFSCFLPWLLYPPLPTLLSQPGP